MIRSDLIGRKLTVIMPVYNEKERIEKIVQSCHLSILSQIPDSELLLVEDGSTDGTKECLKILQKKIPFRLVSYSERKGFASAFKESLALVNSELVFFCDSDGQYHFEDFYLLTQDTDRADIVSGWKQQRQDPFYRIFLSRVFNGILRLLFGFRIHDANSSFKLIRKEVIDVILPRLKTNTPCIMSEFMLRAHLKGFEIREVPIRHLAREGSTSRIFSLWQIPLIVARIMMDLLLLKIRKR